MGANNGSGWPMWFKCPGCRKEGRTTMAGGVVLTHKSRPYKGGNQGVRGSRTIRQYRCLSCGHVGWSRHNNIERLTERDAL